MPSPRYVHNDYFGAMDRPSYFLALDEQAPLDTQTPSNASYGLDSGLSTWELGTTLNPMQNQLQALQAKIREGASKVEFEFAGKGKGTSQASTPESYGKEEREMMRRIAQLNDIKSSTHATFNVAGLAGFSERGFNKRAQKEAMQEVQRAIDFAKDATTGGAIVVHTGEWNRPVETYYGKEDDKNRFKYHVDEDKQAQMLVVDDRTGEIITGIAKDREVVVPKWMTAKDLEEKDGRSYTGKNQTDVEGNPVEIQPDDYVDMFGNKIDPTKPSQLFRRVPKYSNEKGDIRFETDTLDWEQLEEQAKEFSQRSGKKYSTEQYFALTQIDNQILQNKGGSLFHLQNYEKQLEEFNEAKKALDYYKHIKKNNLADDKDLTVQLQSSLSRLGINTPTKQEKIEDVLKDRLKELELGMRHTHQSSSSSDVAAREAFERRDHLKTVQEYGLKETGKALARLAEEAMDKSKAARAMRDPDEKFEDLYIAPENWHPGQYGSHPDELLNIVQTGREEFVERMVEHRKMNKQQAQELAKKHIKTTFDIGHLNMWRSMMERNDKESDEQFQNRFNNWVFEHLEKLDEKDALGHLHLTDNFGYDDEHLSLGQGNAPVKEFVKWMQEKGHTDFIIEPGSFNPQTIMHDGWSYLGAGPRRMHRPSQNFQQQRNAHAGFYQGPNFVTRSYVPINDFSLWSDVPLE